MKFSNSLVLSVGIIFFSFQPDLQATPFSSINRWTSKIGSRFVTFMYKHWKPIAGIATIGLVSSSLYLYKNRSLKLNTNINDLAQSLNALSIPTITTSSHKTSTNIPETAQEKNDLLLKLTLTTILQISGSPNDKPFIFNKFKKELQTLLDQGANINAQDNNGLTPFALAVFYNNQDLAKHLMNISKKTDPNKPDKGGHTPLHHAVTRSFAMVQYLVNLPTINLNVKNDLDETPLDIAQFEGNSDIARLLINKGAQ